jgi:predicted MPP superfamily phosphohydrolase
MPLLTLYVLSALFHGYVAWRLLPSLGGEPVAFWGLAGVLCASVVLMPQGLLVRRRGLQRVPWAAVRAWSGLLCMGLFSSLFTLTVLRDGMLAALWLLRLWWPACPAYPDATAASALAVALLSLLFTLRGLANARRTARVVTVDVPLPGLPAALNGLRIVQISDIHVGPTIRHGYVEAIVQAVNRLQADLVAVTGDLVDGTVAELWPHVAPLAGLQSRHGTFFVTGNHEYYAGAHAWIAELRRLGMRVLMNEHVVLQHGDACLVLAGVADFSAHHVDPNHRSDPHAALAGAPASAGARVLLAHQPRSAEAAADAGFDLQLSGHTHGGQFWPWNYFVPLQQPFTAGLHRWHALWVYTSRGTGYWGPPKRLGAPSEITQLRLLTAPT